MPAASLWTLNKRKAVTHKQAFSTARIYQAAIKKVREVGMLIHFLAKRKSIALSSCVCLLSQQLASLDKQKGRAKDLTWAITKKYTLKPWR